MQMILLTQAIKGGFMRRLPPELSAAPLLCFTDLCVCEFHLQSKAEKMYLMWIK